MPLNAMSRFLLTAILSLLTTFMVGQDVEPNNSWADAKFTGSDTTFRGTFGPTDPNDYFIVGDANKGPLRLTITVRILSGPLAGTDNFSLRYGLVDEFGNYVRESFSMDGDRRGIRTVINAFNAQTNTGKVFLWLYSPVDGEYEVNLDVTKADENAPNILFRPYVRAHLRHELASTREEVRFRVRDYGVVRSIRVRSPGNPPLSLRPFTNPFDRTNLNVRYPLKRIRPSETLIIRVEDVSGNVRVRRVTFNRV